MSRSRYSVQTLLKGLRVGASVQDDLIEAFCRAVDLEAAGDDRQAEQWYRVAADGGYPDARNNLGLLLRRAGRNDEALPYLIAAAETGDSDSCYNLALLHGEMGDDEQAERWYRRPG